MVLFLGILCPVSSQTEVTISKPILQFTNNNVFIYYDLAGPDPDLRFDVTVDVTDSAGNELLPGALTGDVGEGIQAGRRNLIVWDLSADNVLLSTVLHFKVNATWEEPVQSAMKELPLTATEASNTVVAAEYNRGALVLQSLVFPGWGLSRAKKSPHWLKGLLGYGLLATSGVYYTLQTAAYDEYTAAATSVDRDQSYSEWEKKNLVFQSTLFSAAGVWGIELIWTIIGTGKNNNMQVSKGYSLHTTYDALSSAPMITMRYCF
jgi:hypothetical protein